MKYKRLHNYLMNHCAPMYGIVFNFISQRDIFSYSLSLIERERVQFKYYPPIWRKADKRRETGYPPHP